MLRKEPPLTRRGNGTNGCRGIPGRRDQSLGDQKRPGDRPIPKKEGGRKNQAPRGRKIILTMGASPLASSTGAFTKPVQRRKERGQGREGEVRGPFGKISNSNSQGTEKCRSSAEDPASEKKIKISSIKKASRHEGRDLSSIV